MIEIDEFVPCKQDKIEKEKSEWLNEWKNGMEINVKKRAQTKREGERKGERIEWKKNIEERNTYNCKRVLYTCGERDVRQIVFVQIQRPLPSDVLTRPYTCVCVDILYTIHAYICIHSRLRYTVSELVCVLEKLFNVN